LAGGGSCDMQCGPRAEPMAVRSSRWRKPRQLGLLGWAAVIVALAAGVLVTRRTAVAFVPGSRGVSQQHVRGLKPLAAEQVEEDIDFEPGEVIGKDNTRGYLPNNVEAIDELLEMDGSINEVILDEADDEVDGVALADADFEAEEEKYVKRTPGTKVVTFTNQPVFDLWSLCDKYGGVDQILQDGKDAAKAGLFNQVDELKDFLYNLIDYHNKTVRKSFVKFSHEKGSRLVLVGTNHLSRESSAFAREVVRDEAPECLVLERRMGDDSLQRLTVPEELYQNMTMPESPAVLVDDDTGIDRLIKWQQDKAWLESSPGFKNIGYSASFAQEFGAAFEEFARQRAPGQKLANSGGPRGGTVCFGDSDLRSTTEREMMESLRPGVNEMSEGANMPLRDLQMAQAARAAMLTHRSVVAVVGKDHLAGITKLLKQDKRIKVTDQGISFEEPSWAKELKRGGKNWEKAASGGRPALFLPLVEAFDQNPFGTFLAAEAALELQQLQEETAKRLKTQGPDSASAAGGLSSELAENFYRRNLVFTPRTREDLSRWLAGESVEEQEAGFFPYEKPDGKKARPRESTFLV